MRTGINASSALRRSAVATSCAASASAGSDAGEPGSIPAGTMGPPTPPAPCGGESFVGGRTLSRAVDRAESLRLAAFHAVERAIDQREAGDRGEIVLKRRHARRREWRIHGEGAQAVPRVFDR